ncbi:large neutral amino acids transporter small subunit 1-like isoform X2 [Crassostrea angulata]|uniref:Y+L amino acid transporter 2 n=3 Tax=Magallana gigas TaxID=29159 RepID=A0A8W8L8J3_MAGGI|nr:large neutral amino acids transporter small subunit 1-like isoform X1 [Crassostrea gigas]XP_034301775.1 large neutral amino acids transporter small subunit 1-like isoform X1 [Crassostrea gigas]XP_052673337.1 large neutral amino acids transporter small subunit 1-like isoform X2 [Crassostrea angulata]
MESKRSEDSDDIKIEKVIIKRQITLLHGVAIIVGIIIGSGIFVSPVGILKEVKSVGFSLVMWVLCGIYNTLCAICYAELGTTIPESGGEYIYIKRAFGDIPAFICLWINFLLICPVGIAASALIFSLYILKPVFPDCDIPEEGLALIAACIFCLLIAVNCHDVKWAAKVQVVITASKLIALAIIIIIGMYYIIGKGETENFQNAFEGSDYRAGAIAISFYSGFWAYSGWSYLNFLVGELVEPNKNLPRAIMISMTLVIVTYLIANVAYLGVLSPGEMLQSPAVAVTFGERTMGIMAWLMPVLIALSVTGTMNGTALSMSRLFFVGAQNKQFPTFMSMIDMKRMTPSPSLLVILLLTMLYVSSKDIFFLIEMEGFGFASVLTMVFAGQVYLRYKEPSIPRPIRVHIALPISLFLISLGIVILTFYQKPKESFMALGLVAIGLFLYFIGTWKQKPKEITDKINSFNILIQKLLIVIPPDNADEVDWE